MLIVAGVAVAVFVIGAATDAFDPLQPLVRGSSASHDVLGGLLVFMIGLAFVAVSQARTARRETARAAEAEERLRTLVERVPAIAYSWDSAFAEGSAPADYVSPQIEQMLGVSPRSWIEDPEAWSTHAHPDDRDRVLAAWRAACDARVPFSAEYRLRTVDGRWVWVRDEANPVGVGAHGAPIYQGVIVDITEHHDAEEQVRDAERRWRLLLEHLPIVAYEITMNDRGEQLDRWIAAGIRDLVGVADADWLARQDAWEDSIHAPERDEVLAAWRRLETDGVEFDVQYRMRHADGHLVWVHDRASLAERDGKRIIEGAYVDITQWRRAEAALGEAEERFRTLVEQLPVAIYTDAVDDIATAVYISPQYERLTGYTPEQRLLDPQLWVNMLHPEDRDRVLAVSDATNETGEPFDVEYRIVAADGRIVWLHDHAVQVVDRDGNRRWHGVLQDITENKAAAEALARRDAILEATSFAAERFLRSAAWREQLSEVLERLGTAGQATRCAVFRNHELPDGTLAVSIVDSWAVDASSVTDDPSFHDFGWVAGGFERWVTELGAGRILRGRIADFPEEERALLEDGPVAIRSLLAIPIFAEGSWWGYISFDHAEDDRGWSEADTEALALTASTIGAAIERELAVTRLDEAETLYRSLIEQLPAITYIEDHETGDQLYVSPQVRDLLGYTFEEFGPYEGWNSKIHPDDRDRVEAVDLDATARGEPFRCEYRLITADGGVVWVRDEATLVRDADGAPRYWQGVLFDITPAKEAEDQLRQAEERYRLLVEEMPVVSYLDELDPETGGWVTRYISPQVERIFGYPPDEWLGDQWRWRSMIHPDDGERAAEADAHHYATGEPLDIELRMFDDRGRERWVRDQAVIMRDDDGAPRFSQGIIQDVTERKLAEVRLRDAEQRYRGIVEHVPAAIYLDRPGSNETTYISPQIIAIAGVTPQEWIDDPDLWLSLVVPEDRDAVSTSYARALEAAAPWQAEYRIRTPEGRTVWIHDETTVLLDDDGAPLFVQGVLFDITERKLAEQALRESEQREREAAERLRALDEMKNTFLAAVSHELRSPLTSILGLALTLERAPAIEGQDRDDLLARLAANAKKLDRLLKDLLDIDRLNRGIVAPQYRVTDVAALARRTVEHLDALVGREVIVETDPVVIPVDPPKVERIVENLLMNAVRHTDRDRKIWLIVAPHEGGVRITVEDDGRGVPPELRAAIFEPFRQGPSRSPHAPGTGIGLSLVARFAELHGGRAWADDRDGGGAAFHVVIPGRVPEQALDGPAAADAAADARADTG